MEAGDTTGAAPVQPWHGYRHATVRNAESAVRQHVERGGSSTATMRPRFIACARIQVFQVIRRVNWPPNAAPC